MALEAQEVAVRVRLLGGSAFETEAAGVADSVKGIGTAAAESNIGSKMEKETEVAGNALSVLSGRLDSFAKKAHQIARYTAPVSIAAAALIGVSVKEAVDAERQFKLLETQAHATKKQRQELERGASSFAKFGYGPKEVAEALYPLQSVFQNVTTDQNALRASAMGAKIGLDSLPSTVEALTSAWDSGHKGVKSFREEMALLDETVGAGKMHLPELNSMFKNNLFPVAGALGIPQRDILAALAAASRDQSAGGAVSFATLLRTTLIKAITLKGAGLRAAEKLGFGKDELQNLLQTSGGFENVIKRITEDKKTMGNESTQDIATMFGGARSAGTIFLSMSQLPAYTKILARLEGVKGDSTLESHYAQTTETLGAQFEKVTAQLKDVSVELGRVFGPYVLQGFHMLGTAAQGVSSFFHELPGPVKVATGAFLAFLAVLAPAAFIVSGVATAFKVLLSPFTGGPGAAAEITGSGALFAETVEAAGASFAAEVAGGGAVAGPEAALMALRNAGMANILQLAEPALGATGLLPLIPIAAALTALVVIAKQHHLGGQEKTQRQWEEKLGIIPGTKTFKEHPKPGEHAHGHPHLEAGEHHASQLPHYFPGGRLAGRNPYAGTNAGSKHVTKDQRLSPTWTDPTTGTRYTINPGEHVTPHEGLDGGANVTNRNGKIVFEVDNKVYLDGKQLTEAVNRHNRNHETNR